MNGYLISLSLFTKQEKIIDLSNLKAFVDKKIIVTEKNENWFRKGRKHSGKGENAGLQHFIIFPLCFKKLSFNLSQISPGFYASAVQVF